MTESVQSGTDCLERAKLGTAWLLQQQNLDGGWKELKVQTLEVFYRAAWTLEVMGERAAAERSLNYVKKHLMTPEGDFTPRAGAWHNHVHYPYSNAIVLMGAQPLARFDVARPALRFLLSQQDPTYGGFYMVRTSRGERSRMNSKSTAMGGLACLACGEIEAARRAGDWLCRLIELQPALGERFYTTTRADGALRTDFTPEEARWHMVDMKTKESQCWYALGLPFAFAVQLSEATGEPRYAGLVRSLFDIQTACGSPWDGSSSGKGAWASSMLYRIAGDPKYREIALHVAGNFVQRQMPEGWFKGWAYVEPKPGESPITPQVFETTLEFVLWLGLIGENLLARDSD